MYLHVYVSTCLQIWLALLQFPTSHVALHSCGTSKCQESGLKWTARYRHDKSGTLFREFKLLRMEDLSERVAEDRALLQAGICSVPVVYNFLLQFKLWAEQDSNLQSLLWQMQIALNNMLSNDLELCDWALKNEATSCQRSRRCFSLMMWFARRQNHLRLTYEPWQWTTVSLGLKTFICRVFADYLCKNRSAQSTGFPRSCLYELVWSSKD